jgi:type IV pilus assembly protein PilQ
MLTALLLLAPQSTFVSAQSLEEELSILDDLPEADMSAANGTDTAQADAVADLPQVPEEPVAEAPTQSLEDEIAQLPPEETPPAPEAEPDAPSVDTAESEAIAAETPAPPAALTGIEAEPTAHLTAMDFQQLPDRVRLRLRTDRGIDYQIIERAERRQVTIELQNSNIAAKVLKRALDTGEFDGPVALVKAFESKAGAVSSVKVLFQLRNSEKAQVTRVGTELLVDFPIRGRSGKLFEIASDAPVLPETILSSFDKMTFSGARMNLRVKEAPLSDVLALISRASGQDFVLSKATDQKVTIQMTDAPWDQVLAMILLNANMGYQKIGKTYRISAAEELRKELDAALASDKKKKELAVLESRIFPINYAKADDLEKIVKNFLTKERGTSSVEVRTNSIVVTDVSEVLDRVGTYLNKVDLQTPQVLIEARVVQVSDIVTKNLDLRWRVGGDNTYVNLGLGGASGAANAAHVTNEGAGFRFSTSLPGMEAITALLNMYEAQNESKTISSPKVTALNNQKAEIFDGIEIPVETPAAEAGAAPTIVYKEALLKLAVTPSVTTDGYVRMDVQLDKDDIADQDLGTINRKGARSMLMVESGKTAVIGGVFIDVDTKNETRMSYLGSLPVLGRLFTPIETHRREQRELLMFISPRILNADKATLMSSGASSKASF